MDTQQIITKNIDFDPARTVLGELKAYILKKQENERIAVQPNMAVDHLSEEKVLEPVTEVVNQIPIEESTITPVQQTPVVPTENVHQQVISPVDTTMPNITPIATMPGDMQTQVVPQQVNITANPVQTSVVNPINNVIPNNVPEVAVNPMEMQVKSVPVAEASYVNSNIPASASAPVQTQLVDALTPESNSNYLGGQNVITEKSPSLEDVPAISVGDFSVPNIDSSSMSNESISPVSNPSMVAIDPAPTVLDTGIVNLPNGTTSDIANDPSMVVGPESFTRNV